MKPEQAVGSGRNGIHVGLWTGIGALLLLPLAAMQFSTEMSWTGFDFAAAAVLLVGAGLAFELACRMTREPWRRAAIGAVLVALVLTAWAEGSVGILS